MDTLERLQKLALENPTEQNIILARIKADIAKTFLDWSSIEEWEEANKCQVTSVKNVRVDIGHVVDKKGDFHLDGVAVECEAQIIWKPVGATKAVIDGGIVWRGLTFVYEREVYPAIFAKPVATKSVSLRTPPNQQPTQKDRDRIRAIIEKANGNEAKEEQLARAMANSIDDVDKAVRRAIAAEEPNWHNVAMIFWNRAQQLGYRG